MTVCAVMLVRDEQDIIEATVRHLLTQVDEIIIADNMSSDETPQILETLRRHLPGIELERDEEVGYFQSAKTTALALRALERGHQWVLPCDADEIWHAGDHSRPIRDFLDGLAPDVQIVRGEMYHHIPTAYDPEDENPIRRIGWRKREHGDLPKVCCRCRPDLVIHMGNHSASTAGTALTAPGLNVRHFSWRTREQYLHKVRVGEAAYAAGGEALAAFGDHWKKWADLPDEAILDHFDTWFYSADPEADSSLMFDPAPVQGQDDVE